MIWPFLVHYPFLEVILSSTTKGCFCPPTKIVINDVMHYFCIGCHVNVHPNTLVFLLIPTQKTNVGTINKLMEVFIIP